VADVEAVRLGGRRMSDEPEMTETEIDDADRMQRALFRVIRDKRQKFYIEAQRRSIITNVQRYLLLKLHDELDAEALALDADISQRYRDRVTKVRELTPDDQTMIHDLLYGEEVEALREAASGDEAASN
jgi:hypothetical protein